MKPTRAPPLWPPPPPHALTATASDNPINDLMGCFMLSSFKLKSRHSRLAIVLESFASAVAMLAA